MGPRSTRKPSWVLEGSTVSQETLYVPSFLPSRMRLRERDLRRHSSLVKGAPNGKEAEVSFSDTRTGKLELAAEGELVGP